jgi:hypothetical protein
MSKKKTSTPETPTFQVDPNVAWSQDRLKDQYGYLMNGLTQEGQSLSGGLGEATNISPEISRLSQQYAQSQLDPAFRTQRQDLINTLEANNQLTGSTTASSLGNLSADYMASLTGMQAQYGLADVSRALNNRMQLYTTGLNIGQNVGQAGLQNQEQMNQFALQNYENQVAAAMMNKNNSSAGLWGSLGGAALGAGAGALLALPTGGMSIGMGAALGAGLGGSLGGAAFGGSSAGGQMSSGLGMLGGYMAGSKYAPTAYTYTRGPESVTDLSRSYQPLGSYARSQGLL